MNIKQKQYFKEYANTYLQLQELQEKLDHLRPLLTGTMEGEKLDQVKSDTGTFSLAKKKNWQYLPIVLQQEQAIKKMKLEQQRTGKATFTETSYIIFRMRKST